MAGELEILNVGEGDTKLTFDPRNPKERERAARIVKDMLKRGYALLVQVGKQDGKPLYQRAVDFDPDTCEYIVAAGPDEVIDIGREISATESEAKPRRGGTKRVGIPAEKTRATAIARTAGG
jgi:hypothetical protein